MKVKKNTTEPAKTYLIEKRIKSSILQSKKQIKKTKFFLMDFRLTKYQSISKRNLSMFFLYINLDATGTQMNGRF